MASQKCPECGTVFDPEKHTQESSPISDQLRAVRELAEQAAADAREARGLNRDTPPDPPAPPAPEIPPAPASAPARTRLVLG